MTQVDVITLHHEADVVRLCPGFPNIVKAGLLDGRSGAQGGNRTRDLRITRTFDFVRLMIFSPFELVLFAPMSARCRLVVPSIPYFLDEILDG